MSEFHVPVVRLGAIEKHPNADTLSITKVYDYPVILRTGEFAEGDLAAYVPVDAVVPMDDPRWAFLGVHTRIKAKRLRGIFSMGLLAAPPAGAVEGDDVRGALRIEKYEAAAYLSTAGEVEKDPGFIPVYTDLEGLRRWPNILVHGEEVVLTEKIHGANARFVHDGTRLWCGSRTQIKREAADSIWWQAAKRYDLAERLSRAPGRVLYGEVYGRVQDLRYDVPDSEGVRLAFFDVLIADERRYLDHDDAWATIDALGLPRVPILSRGPWDPSLLALAEGKSTLAANVREGFVVKPVRERWHDRVGRVILKMPGEGYLTRRGA